MSRIYFETSIASFYFEVREEPEMVARRKWTRRWFDQAVRSSDTIITSVAAIAELERGAFPGKTDAIQLFESITIVDVSGEILRIAAEYITRKVMPNDPTGDALHLAVASVLQCDYLVTWNCRHLANANKFGHIRRVNLALGLRSPELVTPLELLNESAAHDIE